MMPPPASGGFTASAAPMQMVVRGSGAPAVNRLLGFRMSLRGGVARTVLTSSDSSDERNPPGGNAEIHLQPTTEDLMQKMIGALVTVTLKIGPQIRGRLLSIDKQWNIMLQKPVEQWVNNTLVAVDEADVFVRYHNVIDFGVLRGTEDPATVTILQDMGLRPGEEGWGDEPNPNKFSSEAEYMAASQARK
jgi:small nuclear ribonucleoprotein (snRNP)-like protein